MPGMDGTGPVGAGALSGRGLGFCGTARPAAFGPGLGRGRGFGGGFGRGMGGGPGRGLGRRLGWFSVGYGAPGEGPTSDIRAGLEERRALLRAELDRTEALLKSAEGGVNAPDEGAGA